MVRPLREAHGFQIWASPAFNRCCTLPPVPYDATPVAFQGATIGQERFLLFLAQLPAAPSSARVSLWRRLRGAGAASVLNGAWLLPPGEQHAALLNELAETVKAQGGNAVVFLINEPGESETAGFVARFTADRAREYAEFAERCGEFLAEIEKEKKRRKFTFAELEEIEDDLEKLTAWLGKIRARDFYPGEESHRAKETLERCGIALKAFAQVVYAYEGVSPVDDKTAKPRTAS